jgi:hypothetical protein
MKGAPEMDGTASGTKTGAKVLAVVPVRLWRW